MKKKLAIILSAVITVACLCGIGVYATDSFGFQVERIPVVQHKNLYAYYNDSSCVGAVAFSLDNKFSAFGTTEENIRLCTKNADGSYSALYTIEKDYISVKFAGKQDYTLSTGEDLSALLGGIDGIGISFDREKTSFVITLAGQPINKGTAYYVYIPSDYFVDAEGKGNVAAYLTIAPTTVNSYTGDLLTDLQNSASGLYDAILFAAEAINGALS